jgi:hypothetical protein
MNRSVADTSGEVLVVSQFTLYGDTSGGRRPSWIKAAGPDEADVLDRTGISEQAVRTREVPLRDGRTIYSRLGEIPFVLAALAVVVLGLLLARRDDRRAAAQDDPDAEVSRSRGGASQARR